MQQSFIKSKSANKIDLTSFFISETIFNDANIVIRKREIKYFTHITITSISAVKSIASYKTNLLIFTFIESVIFKNIIVVKLFLLLISLLIYRAVSPSLFTYETLIKLYLIVADLYIRYASLKFIKFVHFRFTIRRIMIVLFIIFI